MIDASAVLTVWERASGLTGLERAGALAAAGTDAGTAAGFALGRRDAALLRLYRDLRGPVVEALATCPACDTTLDVQLPVADLLAGYAPDTERAADDPVGEFDLGTVRVRARCPTTEDLRSVAASPDVETAALALLARCVQSVQRPDGSAVGDAPALSPSERQQLGVALEVLDPLVDTRVAIACADCGEAWSALLDVAVLAWAQVRSRARRLLREVDALAARYGWSEADILSLSEARRAAYLELG